MKKTFKEIKSSLPDINSEKVEILSDELDRVLSLKKIFQSDDGKVLLDVLRNNCFVALNKLRTVSKENPTLEQLLGLVSSWSANIDLLAQIQDISQEKELRDQLDQAVKDAMDY